MKHIKPSNLPPRVPILSTLVLWLLLDRLHPAGWVLGLVWGFWFLWCLLSVIAVAWCLKSRAYVDVLAELDKKCECGASPAAARNAEAAARREAGEALKQAVRDAMRHARQPPGGGLN
jgi:hypothetical protein